MSGLTLSPASGVRYLLVLSALAAPATFTAHAQQSNATEKAQPAAHTQPATGSSAGNSEARGDLLREQRRYVAAIEAYREDPAPSAVVLNKLGMAYQHVFSYDSARQSYSRALSLHSNDPGLWNNLGTLDYAQRDYRSAERSYKKALTLEGDDPTVLANLSTLYYAEKKYRKAEEIYRRAFAINPEIFIHPGANSIDEACPRDARAEMHYAEAKSFAQAGKSDLAIDALRRAIDEGFSSRKQIMEDKEFATLRESPKFQRLLEEHIP